jgi:hypothetical protein
MLFIIRASLTVLDHSIHRVLSQVFDFTTTRHSEVMLKESAVELLNSQLTAIFQKESFCLLLDDLNDDEDVSGNLSIIYGALIVRSHDLDGRVALLQPNKAVTVTDIFKSVEDLKPHFEATSTFLKYRLVSLLCSHLQVNNQIHQTAFIS